MHSFWGFGPYKVDGAVLIPSPLNPQNITKALIVALPLQNMLEYGIAESILSLQNMRRTMFRIRQTLFLNGGKSDRCCLSSTAVISLH